MSTFYNVTFADMDRGLHSNSGHVGLVSVLTWLEKLTHIPRVFLLLGITTLLTLGLVCGCWILEISLLFGILSPLSSLLESEKKKQRWRNEEWYIFTCIAISEYFSLISHPFHVLSYVLKTFFLIHQLWTEVHFLACGTVEQVLALRELNKIQIENRKFGADQGKSKKKEKVTGKGGPLPTPFEKPPFTLKQLRDAIPPHCFIPSTFKSMYHLMGNLLICGLYGMMAKFLFMDGHWIAYMVLYPFYAFYQAMFLAGIWVIAHEASHEAFSSSKIVNDGVGLILHSFYLVPFYNFRYTHQKHHGTNGSLENGESFVPPSRSMVQSPSVEMIADTPLYHAICQLFTIFQLVPGYFFFGYSGTQAHYGQNCNRWSRDCIFFRKRQTIQIISSNMCVLFAFTLLSVIAAEVGVWNFMVLYGVPYVGMNLAFIVVTLCHHTDTYLPVYPEQEWTWMRGALATVDRSLGPFLDAISHEITTTHVLHHLFPRIPFYHAVEATKSIKNILGDYYLYDDRSILVRYWNLWRECKFVEDEDSVKFYQSQF